MFDLDSIMLPMRVRAHSKHWTLLRSCGQTSDERAMYIAVECDAEGRIAFPATPQVVAVSRQDFNL